MNLTDIRQFCYNTALFRPVKVHQKCVNWRQTSQNWPKCVLHLQQQQHSTTTQNLYLALCHIQIFAVFLQKKDNLWENCKIETATDNLNLGL